MNLPHPVMPIQIVRSYYNNDLFFTNYLWRELGSMSHYPNFLCYFTPLIQLGGCGAPSQSLKQNNVLLKTIHFEPRRAK